MKNPVSITYEETPNPESLKFLVSQTICNEVFQAKSPAEAKRSPLASKILAFPWAKGVFIGKDFVTVTKEDWVEWDILKDPLSELIREHVVSGDPVLLPAREEAEKETSAAEGPEQRIQEIIKSEIQPAVAMDGGHIEFVSYKKGKVYVDLQGACSGCPSAAYTLKEGIETRLKQELPEIEEIVPV